MPGKIIYATLCILFFPGFLLSCKNKLCENENFFSTYQKRFEVNKWDSAFIKSDLWFKRNIFSILCIPDHIDKMLIVEIRSAYPILLFERAFIHVP